MLHAMLLLLGCVCVCARVITGASARDHNGNFLDDKWLTARWDRFHDEPGSWSPGKAFDQALDPAKDPCLKIKCGRNKKCVTEDYKTATCFSLMSLKNMNFKPTLLKCKRCPVVRPVPVCATDTHTYSSKCQMEYQACISKMQISVKCTGQCPCPSERNKSVEKKECSDAELKEVEGRLRDWIRDLHERREKLRTTKPQKVADGHRAAICKGSLGWMFTSLDANADLHLDQSELAGLRSGRSDTCTKAFLRSCDLGRDQLISSQEWCACFQRHQESPCQSKLNSIHKLLAGKKLLGQYIPSCDKDGFYKHHQCHGSSGQCWCVDRYGSEIAGSRRMGPAGCAVEGSGDPGSGDILISDDEDDDVQNDDDEEYDDDDGGYLS